MFNKIFTGHYLQTAKLLFFRLLFISVVLDVLAVCSKEFIPPDERRRVVADKVVVMEVVEPSASVARYEVHWVEERHMIATVHLDGLHQPDCHPGPHHNEMIRRQNNAEKESEPKYYTTICRYYAMLLTPKILRMTCRLRCHVVIL